MIATASIIAKLAILRTKFSCMYSTILTQNSAIMSKNAFQSVSVWAVFRILIRRKNETIAWAASVIYSHCSIELPIRAQVKNKLRDNVDRVFLL